MMFVAPEKKKQSNIRALTVILRSSWVEIRTLHRKHAMKFTDGGQKVARVKRKQNPDEEKCLWKRLQKGQERLFTTENTATPTPAQGSADIFQQRKLFWKMERRGPKGRLERLLKGHGGPFNNKRHCNEKSPARFINLAGDTQLVSPVQPKASGIFTSEIQGLG